MKGAIFTYASLFAWVCLTTKDQIENGGTVIGFICFVAALRVSMRLLTPAQDSKPQNGGNHGKAQ